jgi:hypothetical protein
MRRTALLGTSALALGLAASGAPALGQASHDETGSTLHVIAHLNGPRGIDALGDGMTLVTESDGTFSLVKQRRHKPARVIKLGQLSTDFPPAISKGRHGTIYLLTGAMGGPPESGRQASMLRSTRHSVTAVRGSALYKWRPGWANPRIVADIAKYQASDPDPYDQEGFAEDSNPFGVVALKDGTVLVSDAAGNDLLRVWPHRRPGHRIKTVARLKPRLVRVPAGLPDVPPSQGGPLPPAGTPILSEAVATSVTVGKDGYWYVGELRGFPATPGKSEIWRIKPGTKNAVCNPTKPRKGKCKRYVDGLTSIVDLGAGRRGIYAVELSKMSWFQMELGVPGSEVGGLFLVKSRRHPHRIHEMVRNQLIMPGGVDVGDRIEVVGPIFGPGALMSIK